MSSLFQIWKISCRIMEKLKLPSVVCVFDQAIYSKACEIVWKRKEMFQEVVFMLGNFHLTMMFLGVIGKHFGDVGLWDAMVQSDLIAQGSVDKALPGHMYNRAVRMHKLMYESLMRILCNWMKARVAGSEAIENGISLQQFDESLKNMATNLGQQSFQETLESSFYKNIQDQFRNYKKEVCKGDLQKFCLRYLEMKDQDEVSDLHSLQEEADTRLFLHVKHAELNSYSNFVVHSPDTDVFVMAIAFSAEAVWAEAILYCSENGKVTSEQLPPISSQGWYFENWTIRIRWMTCQPAPNEVLSLATIQPLLSKAASRRTSNRSVAATFPVIGGNQQKRLVPDSLGSSTPSSVPSPPEAIGSNAWREDHLSPAISSRTSHLPLQQIVTMHPIHDTALVETNNFE
eukprot:gene11521-12714_t